MQPLTLWQIHAQWNAPASHSEQQKLKHIREKKKTKKKKQRTHTLNPHGDCDLALPVASTYATICVTEIKKIKDEILILLELAFLFGFLLGSVAICRLATAAETEISFM